MAAEKTFTFEGITCTVKRPTMRDAALRNRIRKIVEDREYAEAFADFHTATTSINGVDIQLLNEELAGDIGLVEAAYDKFDALEEIFIATWQANKREVLRPAVTTEDNKKKSSP